MPRVKEFDPDVALGRALELFWERGYEVTSMTDLVEHLGIARASLYATFGGKHDLYLKALDRYVSGRDPDLVAMLSHPGPALPAIRALFEAYLQEMLEDDAARGCLVVNAAIERAPSDPTTARIVQRSWDTLETALMSALMRAQAQGELPSDRDARSLARFLLVVFQGLRVLGRVKGEPERLRDAAEQALAALR